MALHTEQHQRAFGTDLYGTLYYPRSSDKSEEVLEFFKSFTDGKFGWIKTSWGTVHFTAARDGKGAVFTNAVFTEGDRNFFYNLIGKESTDLLLRHHNVRGA
jgi:hypothetical protein